MTAMAVADPWSPLCMDAEEWATWRREPPGRIRVPHQRRGRERRPCDDCPLGYAAEMRAVGKCNGAPAGVSEEDDDMEEPTPVRVVERVRTDETTTRADVTFTLPCEACLHAPVCAIKATLGAAGSDVAVRLPKLDPAVSLRLSATIECAHFLAPVRQKSKAQRSPAQMEASLRAAEIMRERRRAAATA